MKRAVILARGSAGHQQWWGGAFADGLGRRGWRVGVSATADPCDLLVLWGVRKQADIARQKAAGGEVCILERGYIGDRFAWTSVSFGGGLNGRGEFRGPFDDGTRFDEHFGHRMRPWHRPAGGYALLIGQVPGDMSIKHVAIEGFYRQTVGALSRQGWDVRFRAHPLAGRHRPSGVGLPPIGGRLEDAMRGAGVVVTFNSNAGVDAALFGRPVIAMDAGSMAWPVSGHQLDEITMPCRTAWASRLAWCQWSMEEMMSGECQEAVGL